MLPEAGAFELVFLAVVALIVVGPKDLPILLRKVGQFTARMRGLANEFRASFDEMARQSELDELRREVEALRSGSFVQSAAPHLEGHFKEIEAHLTDAAEAAAYGGQPVAALAAPATSLVAHDHAADLLDAPGVGAASVQSPPAVEAR